MQAYFIFMAVAKACIGVAVAIVAAACGSDCFAAAIPAPVVICLSPFAFEPLHATEPHNQSVGDIPVEKVFAALEAANRGMALVAAQYPRAATSPTTTVPTNPGRKTPFSNFGKCRPLSPMNTLTNPPKGPTRDHYKNDPHEIHRLPPELRWFILLQSGNQRLTIGNSPTGNSIKTGGC